MTESGKTSKTVHVVLIETASNQGFVFQSNKLREIVGASGLIHEVGTAWAIKAAADQGGPPLPAGNTASDRAGYLVKAPKFGTNDGTSVVIEPVVVTSGKAVFLVDTRERGEEIVRAVTLRALKCAPGLAVRGAVSKALSLDANAACAGKLVKDLFAEVERLRLELEPAEGRFPLHPPIEPCRTTGLPAEDYDDREVDEQDDGKRKVRLSLAAKFKRDQVDASIARAIADCDGEKLADNPGALSALDWLAVVHADGNGFGQIFLNLDGYCERSTCCERSTARDYFNLYRDLSVSLDLVGVYALRRALGTLGVVRFPSKDGKSLVNRVPLVVSVMGGDDLTVICDGANAVAFAEAYLTAFDEAVGLDKIEGFESVIPGLAQQVSGAAAGKAFGAAAGIAIVKPHHPLHRAYDLAEELTKSAKKLCKAESYRFAAAGAPLPDQKRRLAGEGVSALDFQVIFGDASSSLGAMRSGWKVDDQATLIYARPYATSAGRIKELGLEARDYDQLKQAVDKLRAEDDAGRPLIPRSQQHALREALFDGRNTADTRLNLVAGRYPQALPQGAAKSADAGRKEFWASFGGDTKTLFFSEESSENLDKNTGEPELMHRTRLLDAMELSDIGAFDKKKPDNAGSAEGEQ